MSLLTPPFIYGGEVLRPAAEPVAPAGEGKRRNAGKGREGAPLGVGRQEAEREAATGGGASRGRSAARARVGTGRGAEGPRRERWPLGAAPARSAFAFPSGGAKLGAFGLWQMPSPPLPAPAFTKAKTDFDCLAAKGPADFPGLELGACGGPMPRWRSAAGSPCVCVSEIIGGHPGRVNGCPRRAPRHWPLLGG